MNERTSREVTIEEILPSDTWQTEMLEALHNPPEGVLDMREYLRERGLFLAQYIIKDREQQIRGVIDDAIAGTQNGSPLDTALAIANGLNNFVHLNFSPRELEKNIREYIQNRSDEIINELLHYNVYKERELYLHVSPAKTLSLQEQLRLLKAALPILARKLQTDDKLKKVQTIGAVSWIVAANPGILTKLGFTYKGNLDEKRRAESFPDDLRKVGEAYISREDFLQKYLK